MLNKTKEVTMGKPYDPACHAEHDGPARETLLHYLHSHGFTARNNPDRYAADIIVEGLGYVEVEHKASGWPGHEFTWEELNIPDRKKNHMYDENTIICVLNGPMRRFVMFPASKLKECRKEVVPNKYDRGTLEEFYKVPIHKFQKEGTLWFDDCIPQVEF
jgi:hypothetical protein